MGNPLIYGVTIVSPAIAVSIRRMHDIGLSGWWILISLTAWIKTEEIEGVDPMKYVSAVFHSVGKNAKELPVPLPKVQLWSGNAMKKAATAYTGPSAFGLWGSLGSINGGESVTVP